MESNNAKARYEFCILAYFIDTIVYLNNLEQQ